MSIKNFIRESNAIEGILRQPLTTEIDAANHFLKLSEVSVDDLTTLVAIFQPGAILRNKPGLNVCIGNHLPMQGGPLIFDMLCEIVVLASNQYDDGTSPVHAYNIHQQYEQLHPYTDGNGRSGRMLWLWMMGGESKLGFLHQWYYQSLDAGRHYTNWLGDVS